MRYLVLSDIHANLEALTAVMAAVTPGSYERVLFLGDLVGYGADPNGVVDCVRAMKPDVLIRGNHDKVAAGIDDAEGFNYMAREAARWTFEALTPANREFIAQLPAGPKIVDDLLEICHGAPYDEDAYVFDTLDALQGLKTTERAVCLFGHTHIPTAFVLTREGLEIVALNGAESRLYLEPDCKYLINPGSVGQPRDGDSRAAYATIDTTEREFTLFRVPYRVDLAQEKIRAAGLPEPLAQRLSLGR